MLVFDLTKKARQLILAASRSRMATLPLFASAILLRVGFGDNRFDGRLAVFTFRFVSRHFLFSARFIRRLFFAVFSSFIFTHGS